MDIVTLGAALNGSAEYVNSHFKGGSNIQIVDNPDGTQTINASGEVSSEDTVARADIAAIKDGETLDSFGDVETALSDKADKSTTYTKTEVDTALGSKQNTISDLATIRSGAALGATAVQPETGKGLSTNDYTTAEKTKLDNLAEIKTVGTGLNLDDNGELTATGGGSGGTTNYNDLSNKPQINGNTLSGNKTSAQLGLASASDIPTTLADLSDDSTHRTVSDTEKATWNSKQNAIDSSHKLSADLVDDTSTTNKFATVAELEQIQTNKNNISYIAKNNVINTFIRQTGSYTNNGVTFTTNADCSITLANTATGGAAVLTLSSTLDTTDDTYILYGDGFIDGVYMDTYETGWTNQRTFNSWIDTVPNTKIWRIVVSNGTNADGVTIRPMMCKKSLFDGSYHQYAMSNEQITAWIIAHS